MKKIIYLAIFISFIVLGCHDSVVIDPIENTQNETQQKNQVTEVVDEVTIEETIHHFKWHLIHYYGKNENADIPFTDVYIEVHDNGEVDEYNLGTMTGAASDYYSSALSHVEEDVLSGVQTFYSGAGIVIYALQIDNDLVLMSHQMEEGMDSLPDKEVLRIEMTDDAKVEFLDATIETIVQAASGDVNKENWISHTRVKEIRSIYSRIVSGIENGTITAISKEYASVENKGLYEKTLYLEGDEIVKYTEAYGSDDSAYNVEYYYDEGIIRFIFISGGSVNGTDLEHRVYLDKDGQKFWEIHKETGVGYPFFNVWEEERFVTNPKEAYELE